ncbi:MAG: endonuclease/exonuclease/phosphatase family protein [Chitinophagales bacterium]|nr:endonuclease/exonuclease/phosphatase family protein [Chitinophagales bacterium]
MATKASGFKYYFRLFFLIINLIVALIFVLGCFSPILNPVDFWPSGFVSLVMPYLIITLLFFVLFWLIMRPIVAIFPIIVLLAGYQQVLSIFAFHPTERFQIAKAPDAIRVITWNIHGFNGLSGTKSTLRLIREEIFKTIDESGADVICLQEFNHSTKMEVRSDNIGLFQKAFPYYYFSHDYAFSDHYQAGTILFSKLPIVDTGKIRYANGEHLIWADVVKGKDTIRVYTTHLQSFNFGVEDYANMYDLKEGEADPLSSSRPILRKMREAFRYRGTQADMIQEVLMQNRLPSFICGDFNDVPGSYTYFRVKGDRQDVFLKKDFGIGRTYNSLAPTLRIDYILPDKQLEVLQCDLVDEGLSDHQMLIADLRVRK